MNYYRLQLKFFFLRFQDIDMERIHRLDYNTARNSRWVWFILVVRILDESCAEKRHPENSASENSIVAQFIHLVLSNHLRSTSSLQIIVVRTSRPDICLRLFFRQLRNFVTNKWSTL